MHLLRLAPLLALLPTSLLAAPAVPEDINTLEIGDAAPDFTLKGVDGEDHNLAEYADAELLVILFTCNHCPSAQAVEERVKGFVEEYQARGVQLVAISPNDPLSLRDEEVGYSLVSDSYEDMIVHAENNGFNFPYLYDGDTQDVAKAYGCLATPHIFVFDAGRKLRYKGRFDDSKYADPETIKTHDCIDAVEALLSGKEVAVAETRPHGCSTKWAFKRDVVVEHVAKIASTPVEAEVIDLARLTELATGESPRYRLINFWATWCAPCRAEFPDLVAISQKFGLRDFEFISISTDDADQLEQVNAFLSAQGAATPERLMKKLEPEGRSGTHFVLPGAEADAIADALGDPDFPGPIPYSILVGPDGDILWRHSPGSDGPFDRMETSKVILGHLGRYFPLPE